MELLLGFIAGALVGVSYPTVVSFIKEKILAWIKG